MKNGQNRHFLTKENFLGDPFLILQYDFWTLPISFTVC